MVIKFSLYKHFMGLSYKNLCFDLMSVTCDDQSHDLSLTFSYFLSVVFISFLELNIKTILLFSHQ